LRSLYSTGDGSICDLRQHVRKQPPREMALRQQQPVVARMLYEPSAGLDQPLLQAGQRPGGDPHQQRQPPPEVLEVLRNQAQPQPDLVGARAVAAKPRQRDRLLAFLDPMFGRAALVVEAYHRPVVERQVGHDKSRGG
jgi:hypothetical protein